MKKLLSVVLCALMIAALLPAVHPHTASAEETSGKCGKDICWSLNENTGVLTLYGSGETYDYDAGWQDSPLRQYSAQIKEIVVGEGITKIGHDVFAFCSEVTKVTFPSTLRTLGGFKRCDSLNEIFIPYGVETILKDAFSHSGVQSIVLPETVNNVETHAFYGCHELRTVTMPSHMNEIGVEAFWDCINLESIVIPEGITELRYGVFFGCDNLQHVIMPSSLTTIHAAAFYECYDLYSVVIPEGVTFIDMHAFSRNEVSPDLSLHWISLPASLEKIGSEAFNRCTNLTDVYYAGTQEQREQIEIGEANTYLLSAGWHYSCSTPEDYVEPITVYSDLSEVNNRYYIFRENENVEDVVFSTESTTYNPKLAHFLAVMARAAYSENRIRDNYDKLKLENTQVYHYEDNDPVAGYTIGEKTVGDRRLVMITIRGTNGWSEWLETNFNLGVYSTVYSHGWHSGFNASASTLFEALQARYGDGMTDPNTTYVITGHSLGGAVGNLLSVKLYEAGVSNKNVYDYNFACPNVGMGPDNVNAWNGDGVHNNIINICNWCDWVPSLPGLFSENMSGMNHVTFPLYWQKWKKYGVTYWFDAGFQFFWEAHDMGLYVDWAANESDETHYKNTEYKVTAVMACCPVDVTILDSNGNPVAGTDSESKCYYGYQEGEKAVILVNGDRKLFYLIGDDDWNVQIHATDKGTMDFGVARVYLHGNDVDETITFETVNLTEGKAFISEIDQDAEISDVKLYVVDENGAPIREVHEDGTETPVKQPIEATIEWNAEDVEYRGSTPYVIANGSAQTPRFTVKNSADGSVIDPANYDYEYKENTNAGTGYVIVTFKGDYSGTAQAWFKIYLPATAQTAVENIAEGIRISWAPVEGAAGYVIYRRAWSSTTNGWTDFVRWYNVTGTSWIDGSDDSHKVYAGSRYQYGVKAYFARRTDPVSGAAIGGNVGDNYNLGEVGPLKTTVRITTRKLVQVRPGSGTMTVKWEASKNFTGYQIKYATDANFTKNVVAFKIGDPTTYWTTIKGLKSNTTYYVCIRSYHEFNGMTYFGEWSNVLSGKVK